VIVCHLDGNNEQHDEYWSASACQEKNEFAVENSWIASSGRFHPVSGHPETYHVGPANWFEVRPLKGDLGGSAS
jgi:hypothetical protein